MFMRAHSTLELKAMPDGKRRRFSGIASTPTVDRMGDIVEPKGAVFTLPIPLLWQHNAHDPIGWVDTAKVTDKGVAIEGEVSDFEEEGELSNRLKTAWQYLQAKLVRGLSIGFQSLEHSFIDEGRGMRFTKWSWYELSCVTIPANADCSVNAIKSADEAVRRALLGHQKTLPIVRLDLSAGVPATTRRPGVVYLTSKQGTP